MPAGFVGCPTAMGPMAESIIVGLPAIAQMINNVINRSKEVKTLERDVSMVNAKLTGILIYLYGRREDISDKQRYLVSIFESHYLPRVQDVIGRCCKDMGWMEKIYKVSGLKSELKEVNTFLDDFVSGFFATLPNVIKVYMRESQRYGMKNMSQQMETLKQLGVGDGKRVEDVMTEVRDAQSIISSEEERRMRESARLAAEEAQRVQERRSRVGKHVAQLMKREQVVDLLFLMDATESMGPYVQGVKEKIDMIINNVQDIHKKCKVRVGCVAYRDHCDEGMPAPRLEVLDFTSKIEEFKNFVGSLKTVGGGDTAEDVFGGLHAAATKVTWKQSVRLMMHFADAPCHGSRFHDVILDHDRQYNEKDRNGLEIGELLQALKNLQVQYVFAKIKSQTDKMIAEFRKVSESIYFPEQVECCDSSDILKVVTTQVAETVSSSLSHTSRVPSEDHIDLESSFEGDIQQSGETKQRRLEQLRNRRPIHFFTEEDPKLWQLAENAPTKQWTIEVCPTPEKLDEVVSGTNWNILGPSSEKELRVPTEPFKYGATNKAYTAILHDNERTYKMVAKRPKMEVDEVACRRQCLTYIRAQSISRFLAAEFNKFNKNSENDLKVKYLKTSLMRCKSKPRNGSPIISYYCLEPFLKGDYRKWTTNTGNVVQASETLEAFSHYTYHKTKGYLMVTDLQGIFKNGEFILTDPAIHCEKEVSGFGSTNFLTQGFNMFFENHKCNKVCEGMIRQYQVRACQVSRH
ncbi:unnamed protein product [Discosporangium mesarthrocarpum]